MYTYDKKVLFSEVDRDSNMTLKGIMNSMLDCININSESIGRGIDFMTNSKRAWFLVNWTIEIKRFPKLYEDITAKTWPYSFAGAIGSRNALITDSAGSDIVCADSMWTMIDMEKGRPSKITEEDAKGYILEDKYDMDNPGRKIALPDDFEKAGEITVNKANIDFNGHMSNAEYIEIAYQYVSFEHRIKRIRVEYKNQSKYGEKINIYKSFEDNKYVIVFKDEEDKAIKAVVEFIVD